MAAISIQTEIVVGREVNKLRFESKGTVQGAAFPMIQFLLDGFQIGHIPRCIPGLSQATVLWPGPEDPFLVDSVCNLSYLLQVAECAIYTNDLFLKHDTGMMHPESSRRLEAIVNRMQKSGSYSRFASLEPRYATKEEIASIHGSDYIDVVEMYSSRGRPLDGDTITSEQSYAAATMAAGAGLAAADAIHSGDIKRAVLLVRPPGHHSLPARAMGFCLFNNVGITARYLQSLGYKRPAILDWDVHHGNGTQDIFYRDPSVLFISLHQFPFYPGTGSAAEIGTGEGKGYTLNIPVSSGTEEPTYREAFEESITPRLEEFAPDILLISAGFDAHEKDPLASVELTTGSFEWMSQWALDFASTHCDGRIVSFLEGGYHLEALAESVEVHATTLLG